MLNLYPNSIKVEDGTTHQQIPLTAIKGEPGQNGQNGTNGTNGVSCTHSWSGTTLNVTSASGTSSADLKGAKGDSYTITSADYEAIAEIAEQEYATDLNTVKEDLENLEDDVDEISADVSALQTKESATERSLEMLWKLNKGQTYDIESQTESGTNDAPSGAEYETLEAVYGKSSQQTTNGYNLFDDTQDNYSLRDFSASLGETLKIQVYTTDGDKKLSFRIVYEDGTRSEIGMIVASADNNVWYSASKELTKNVVSCRFFTSGDGTDRVISKVMLEKGSTAHSYEPYTGGIPQPNPSYPSEIVDVTEENFKVVGNENVNLENGYIDASGALVPTQSDKLTPMFEPNGKVYIEWTNPTASKTVSVRVINYDDNKKFLSRIVKSVSIVKGVSGSEEITVSSKYVRVTYDTSMDVKMVYGTPQTRTMSYTLRGIGDYTDVMDVESGKIRRNVGIKELTSSLGWARATTYVFRFADTSMGITNIPMMCKFFARYENLTVCKTGIFHSASYMQVKYSEDSLDSFKNFLNENNVSVYYALATPTEESISADDLAFLRGLENLSADHTITVTDQNGNDISYLVEYIIKLSEVV